jgi:large subunit ribosomal protein L15
MPLQRRVPKTGFTSFQKTIFQIVNVGDLHRCGNVQKITLQTLADHGLIRKATCPVKILGKGFLSCPLEVEAQAFSDVAAVKIRQAGGKINVLD